MIARQRRSVNGNDKNHAGAYRRKVLIGLTGGFGGYDLAEMRNPHHILNGYSKMRNAFVRAYVLGSELEMKDMEV